MSLTFKGLLNGIITGAALLLIAGFVIAPFVASLVMSLLGIKGQGGVCTP